MKAKNPRKITGTPSRSAVNITRNLQNMGINAGAIKQSAQATTNILRQTARATRP